MVETNFSEKWENEKNNKNFSTSSTYSGSLHVQFSSDDRVFGKVYVFPGTCDGMLTSAVNSVVLGRNTSTLTCNTYFTLVSSHPLKKSSFSLFSESLELEWKFVNLEMAYQIEWICLTETELKRKEKYIFDFHAEIYNALLFFPF